MAETAVVVNSVESSPHKLKIASLNPGSVTSFKTLKNVIIAPSPSAQESGVFWI
jgi:predicted methyltransferase